MENNTPQEIWEALLKCTKPICCIDSRMDFDAFCSALTMREVLATQGIKLTLTWHSPVPQHVKDMVDAEDILESTDPKEINFTGYDLLLVLDSGTSYHISLDSDFSLPTDITIVNIDHHPTNEYYGDYNFVDGTSISTCKQIYKFLKELDFEITKQIAFYLQVGHLTDSGFFQYQKVTSEDLQISTDLFNLGASVPEIKAKFSNNLGVNDFKSNAIAYKNFVLDKENNIAYTTRTQFEVEDMDLNISKIKLKAVDQIKRIKDLDLAFSVTENVNKKNVFKISFRSMGDKYDASKIAAMFDGGGHYAAASGDIKDAVSLNDALGRVYKALGLKRPE